MKVYNMQYPMDTRRKEYDGRKHNITPQALRSFDYDNQKLYYLFYFDNDLKKEMYTFLIKKGSSFMKLPINYRFSFKLYNAMKKSVGVSLDELSTEIDCYGRIIEIEELDDVIISLKAVGKPAPLTPPNPPNPPKNPKVPEGGTGKPTMVGSSDGPGGHGGPNGRVSDIETRKVGVGKGPLPPGGSNPITYPSGEVDLHQRFKVIYYNRDNNMYYWDPYCIDLITGPFLVDLLRANTEGLDKGYTQLLAGYDEVSYEVIAVNKKPAKPKLITIYRYHGRYYWDSECQLPYSDEFGVLSMAGVDRSIIDLELVGEKNIRPSLNEVVKPRRIRFLPAALIDTKREYIGRVYFNKDNGLFYWDDDCIDLVTGPLLVELINNKVKDVVSAHGKTMLRVGGISYSVESVRRKDYKINNVYLYEKNNSYYWDPDCTLLVEKGLNEFKSYDVIVYEAKPTKKIDSALEVDIFYNDYDKRMYQDRECTVYMGKIDDIGILDPASKRIRGYDGKTYRLRKTYVNTDTYSEKTGFHK